MENNKTKESQETALEKTNMQGQDLAVHSISSFTQAESLAEWIASSPVFNKEFKEVAITEDGKEISFDRTGSMNGKDNIFIDR